MHYDNQRREPSAVQPSSSSGMRSQNLPSLQGFRAVPKEDKLALMEALYTKGPLAVSIDAGVLKLYPTPIKLSSSDRCVNGFYCN
jgi:hypothetical protein